MTINKRILTITCAGLVLAGCQSLHTKDTEAAAHTHSHGEGEHSHDYEAIVLDGGEGEPIAFPLHETWKLAGPETSLSGMNFFEQVVKANQAGAPPHIHTQEDEFFYVRSGSITFMAEDERRTISAGGFVLLPRNGLHAFWNDTDQDAIILVGTSEGKFGDFFDAVAIEARETNASSPEEIGAILGRLGAERGITIDMSKLPADVAPLYGLPPAPQE